MLKMLDDDAPVVSAGLSHRGLVREHNEDAVLDFPSAGVWAVCDGMGGHDQGDLASQSIVHAIHALALKHTGVSMLNALPDAVKRVNASLLRRAAGSKKDGCVIGSTLAVLLLENDRYHVLWAGDSRVYLLRQSRLKTLTQDHATVVAVAAGDPSQSGGVRHVLTRAVGAEEDLRMEYQSGYLYQGDRFLLCSDGLNKVVSDQEITELMTDEPVDEACRNLLDAALSRGGPDNVSCIVVGVW